MGMGLLKSLVIYKLSKADEIQLPIEIKMLKGKLFLSQLRKAGKNVMQRILSRLLNQCFWEDFLPEKVTNAYFFRSLSVLHHI